MKRIISVLLLVSFSVESSQSSAEEFEFARAQSYFGIAEHMSEPVTKAVAKPDDSSKKIAHRLLSLVGQNQREDFHQLINKWQYPDLWFDNEVGNRLFQRELVDRDEKNNYSVPKAVAAYLTLRAYRISIEWSIDIYPEDLSSYPLTDTTPTAVSFDGVLTIADENFWHRYFYWSSGFLLDYSKFRKEVYRIHVPTAARESFFEVLKKFGVQEGSVQENSIKDYLIQERPFRK